MSHLPQLHRYLFLREAWKNVVDENDSTWIDRAIDQCPPGRDQPHDGMAHALRSLRAKGATNEELTDLTRTVQAELLFSICYLLEGNQAEDSEQDGEDVQWGLFALDGDDDPTDPIAGLHESVLETDPTGREMRPRS